MGGLRARAATTQQSRHNHTRKALNEVIDNRRILYESLHADWSRRRPPPRRADIGASLQARLGGGGHRTDCCGRHQFCSYPLASQRKPNRDPGAGVMRHPISRFASVTPC
jgi:hypothetical protein